MEFREAFDPARALQTAWEAIKQRPWPLLLSGFLVWLTTPGNGWNIVFEDIEADVAVPLAGFLCCGGLVFLFLNSWLFCGLARTLLRVLRTGDTDFAELFADRDRWVGATLVVVLQSILAVVSLIPIGLVWAGAVLMHEEFRVDEDVAFPSALIASVILLPFVFWFNLGFFLARYAVVIEGLTPVEGLRRSWHLLRGHRLWMLLYWVLTSLVWVLGFVCCFFGVIITGTWVQLAWIDSYSALVEERGDWWIETGRPTAPVPPAQV